MSDTRATTRANFRAMGSQATIILTGEHPDSTITSIMNRVEHIESLWSRFRPDSEISRLNRGNGHEVVVSPETAELIRFMIEGNRATHGRFDPSMLNSIIRVGYSRSLVGDVPESPSTITFDFDARGDLDAISIRPVDDRFGVTLPVGTMLDPGGLKGLAADIVLRETLATGIPGALVSLGGDIAVGGLSPDAENECWTINILDPFAKRDISYVRLASGGVATSSAMLRRFSHDTATSHHLLDPRTQESTDNGVFGATVVAGSAAWAEVYAKSLMVGGRRALAELDAVGLGAMVVDIEGTVANNSYSKFETHTTTAKVAA